MAWVVGAVIAVGVVLPFALWCWHERRRRQRERIEGAIAEWYGGAIVDAPRHVMWADPRRWDGPGRPPASSRPD